MAADTQEQAAERKRLEMVFNNLGKAIDCLQSVEIHIGGAALHATNQEIKNPTKPGNYESWMALKNDLLLSIQDVRRELGPAYRDVAQRLYGLSPDV